MFLMMIKVITDSIDMRKERLHSKRYYEWLLLVDEPYAIRVGLFHFGNVHLVSSSCIAPRRARLVASVTREGASRVQSRTKYLRTDPVLLFSIPPP